MSYDLLIRNGSVVDGTGSSGRRADVGIVDGKISEIGTLGESAREVIDASDCVVAPGFIDPHTHYDAQICWDPYITPSSWHGVTTVILGNCGVGIAPCRPEDREVAMRDLVSVEAIEFDVLQKGITWDWESFPEYLDAAARRGSALNLAFLATLTPFRHYVMGLASTERAATPTETAQIQALLKESMNAGAFGFSTTMRPNHLGYRGRPLACRNASRDEMLAYCNVLRECGKGTIEIALLTNTSIVSDEEYELLDLLLTQSGRPVTFTALVQREDTPAACRETLRRLEPLMSRGAVPQTSARPMTREMSLRAPFHFGTFSSWKPVFDKSKEEQAAIYGDSNFRNSFREEMKNHAKNTFAAVWHNISVNEVHSPALQHLEGRTIDEIAKERGTDAIDALLDIGLADDLNMRFSNRMLNFDEKGVAENLRDDRALIGLGDGGAHLDLMCDSGYCTYVLGKWVRDKRAITLEHAIQRMTSHPAEIFGIKDRGRIQVGFAADLVIFDPTTVGSSDRPERRDDLPGGGKRLVMRSEGIQSTIVNGRVVYANGSMTDVLPGQVLRS